MLISGTPFVLEVSDMLAVDPNIRAGSESQSSTVPRRAAEHHRNEFSAGFDDNFLVSP
jgi:hypothetical protein